MTTTTPVGHTRTSIDLDALRERVRTVIADWRRAGRFTPTCDAWLRGHDPDFSRVLAREGWIGMTWPAPFGGGEHTNLARLVVTEELLRSGAPVAAHWMGDRQIGPAILRYGSPELQREYLPRITTGEVTFCLGMSETEAGSDLASVRTTAVAVEGGFRITGRKIWTSHAHRCTHAYVLARSDRSAPKHEGLSEFIVELSAPGVEVRPILDLCGDHHFNEVTFDDVFVPEGHLLGRLGNGWTQVTEQLAFERGGMERLLSTYPLLTATVAAADTAFAHTATGAAMAQLAAMRRIAWRIALAIDAGQAPIMVAATLKDLGTAFERDVTDVARCVLDIEADPAADGHAGLLASGVLASPGFTIRGGTTEVLRTIIAKGLSGGQSIDADESELSKLADDVLRGRGGEPDPDGVPALWVTLEDLGWPWVGIDEQLGGSGGALADLVDLARATGRHAIGAPFAETAFAEALAAAAGRPIAGGPLTVVTAADLSFDGTALHGSAHRVPWARAATRLLVTASTPDRATVLLEVPAGAAGLQITPGANLAGEPRDTIHFSAVTAGVQIGTAPSADLLSLGALLRAAQTVGAAQAALTHTVAHVAARHQFGRPLAAFQAVGSLLAGMAGQLALARAALDVGSDTATVAEDRTAVAAAVAGAAATSIAMAAHQLHGAMGVTREHPLHLSTRRLWSWRDEFGGHRHWSARLGALLAGRHEDDIWNWVTATTRAITPGQTRGSQ
jgi:alkylation response protein AidB-like acyl-CoA dehydrogenase